MESNTTSTAHAGTHNEEELAHPVSVKLLLTTLGALLFLTVVTVAVTFVDLGSANIWIAMAIAILKATIVALFFMHLRWDKPFNGFVLLSAVFFTTLFIAFVVKDVSEYKSDLDAMGPVEQAARNAARATIETRAATSQDDDHTEGADH